MYKPLVRTAMYVVLAMSMIASSSLVYGGELRVKQLSEQTTVKQQSLTTHTELLALLAAVRKDIAGYEDEGIDVTSARERLNQAYALIEQGEYGQAQTLISTVKDELAAAKEKKLADEAAAQQLKQQEEAAAQAAAAEAEAKRGDVKGVVAADGAPLSGATVSLVLGSETLISATTDSKGLYSLHYTEGSYTLTVQKSGYVKTSKEGVLVKRAETTVVDVAISKVPPKPTATPKPATPSPTTSESTAYSSYRQLSVLTERGTFTVKLLTLDLGSGHIRVITDTAANTDCATDCPVKSVKDYVTLNGGFAGVNGTYFCPASYADCAGKTNSFHWKVYNSRLQKLINATNGMGLYEPYFTFDSAGKPKYYSTWESGSKAAIFAGISNRPLLISGGANVLDVFSLDEKEKTTKSYRTGLGIKGQSLYIAVATSATMIDMASIMSYFGVDSAMALDGGGSSALYYNGAYKSGPGRNIPNALVFKEM